MGLYLVLKMSYRWTVMILKDCMKVKPMRWRREKVWKEKEGLVLCNGEDWRNQIFFFKCELYLFKAGWPTRYKAGPKIKRAGPERASLLHLNIALGCCPEWTCYEKISLTWINTGYLGSESSMKRLQTLRSNIMCDNHFFWYLSLVVVFIFAISFSSGTKVCFKPMLPVL